MAFPKKDTRRLTVDGVPYQWHLDADWDSRNRWIVVGRKIPGAGQLLMINPYHHDFLPTRGAVSRAVRFALDHGWNPESRSAPLRLTFAGTSTNFKVITGDHSWPILFSKSKENG